MKKLFLILFVLISEITLGQQMQQINVPGDTPTQIYRKARDNFNYIEPRLDSIVANLGSGGPGGKYFNYLTDFETGFNPIFKATVSGTIDIPYLAFRSNAARSLIDGISDIKLGTNSGNPSALAGGNITIGNNLLQSLQVGTTWSATPWFSYFQGDRNIAIGDNIANGWTTPASNQGTGNFMAGHSIATGTTKPFSYSVAIGFESARDIGGLGAPWQSMIAIGTYTMKGASMGTSSTNGSITAIGNLAGSLSTFNGGFGSVLIGNGSGYNAPLLESYETLIGGAGQSASLGRGNIGIGERAFYGALGGSPGAVGVGTNQFNVAIGTHTMEGAGPSEKGTYVGTEAGQGVVIGNKNTGYGSWSLNRINGHHNMGIGPYAGYMVSNTITGNGNSFIGPSTGLDVSTTTVNNVMVIGNPTGVSSTTGYRPIATSDKIYVGSIGDIELRSDYDGTPKTVTMGSAGLAYGANYSSTQTDRHLIDRGYANSTYLKLEGANFIPTGTGFVMENGDVFTTNFHQMSVNVANGFQFESWDPSGAINSLVLSPTVMAITDSRPVPKGLEYAGAGYETTDFSLISRGFANSNYLKLNGITLQPGTGLAETHIRLNSASDSYFQVTDNSTNNGVFVTNLSTGFATDAGTFKLDYANADQSVNFEDLRTIKRGIQYSAAGYETTDLSLTSRGYVLGAKTFTGKQSFTATTTTPGLNIGSFAGDPSAPANGDTWYNTSLHTYRLRQNGVNRNVIAGSVGGGNSVVYSTANNVVATDNEMTYDGTTNILTTGGLNLSATPTLDNTNTQILARDATGLIEYVDKSTLGGGSVAWGGITGTLSNQTDLQTALDGKQASDADLTAIAGLAPANDDFIQRKTGAWTFRTPAQVKTDLALTKSDVGLANVDNTSDANKPVSTAQQTAIDAKVEDNITDAATTTAPSENAVFDALALKAPLASPALTGTPTAPTAAGGTNTTQLATTAFVQTAANAKVEDNITDAATTTAPSENAVFDALALKAPLASPALTGTPTAPTATVGTNTTQIATTAFVLANAGGAGSAPDELYGQIDIINRTITYNFGDSYTAGLNASVLTQDAYVPQFSRHNGLVFTNWGESSRGVRRAAQNSTFQFISNPERSIITMMAGLNDLRAGGSNPRTLKKIEAGHRVVAVKGLFNPNAQVGGGASSVTRVGTHTTTFAANTFAGIKGAGALPCDCSTSIDDGNTGSWSYTVTGTDFAVGFIASDDGAGRDYGSVTVKIDNILVKTIDLGAWYDNVSDGLTPNDRGPLAFSFHGYTNASHTILVEKVGTAGLVNVDYFSTLRPPMGASNSAAFIFSSVPIPLQSLDAATEQDLLNGSAVIKAIVDEYRTLRYPFAYADVMKFLGRDGYGFATDGLHPDDIGHDQITDCFNKTVIRTDVGRGEPQHIFLTADQVDNSGANTLQNITGFLFPVQANKTYAFRVFCTYLSAATTTGMRITMTGPASPTRMAAEHIVTLTATTSSTNYVAGYDLPAAASATSLTTGNTANYEGTITIGATSGNVQFQFASEISGSAITLEKGSRLEWRQVD